jgi:hypothetical protein
MQAAITNGTVKNTSSNQCLFMINPQLKLRPLAEQTRSPDQADADLDFEEDTQMTSRSY